MELLTTSRQKAARACLRLHKYSYVEGYKPAQEADVLRLGTSTHAVLERRLHLLRDGVPYEVILEQLLEGELAADPYEAAKLRAMICGYHIRWESDVERYEVLEVECEFTMPLLNPATNAPSRTWMLAGKIDGVFWERALEAKLVVEHKTSSEDISPGSQYRVRLQLDNQVSTYMDGAAALGHLVAGCLYDVLKKPALRPYKATPEAQRKFTAGKVCTDLADDCPKCAGSGWKEAPRLHATQRDRDETPEEYQARVMTAIAEDPASYYQRFLVVRLEAEMLEYRFDTWNLGRNLADAIRLDRAPRNSDACSRYGRTCPFLPVCLGQASLDDETKYRRSGPHPELNQTKEESAHA